ncbi:aldehyde ferredoxin oxidoreductase family protein [Gelria sp. Kuro-4]|uniref:aldehyde ferredoxin oxidoreductase family protein n=1 Tax=Gelria sp. Kuro-4 TaxID=2796927 RepID=UPI001BEDE7F4|nr:aldehyde ferredoxin oxidoreductase family protein [Gelria sp. Kuro-4]BCV24828.1 aldehyde ferredoxin oxidoreductase [Gelria sp. Kuro-4]
MPYGYMGKLLRVDLTQKKTCVEDLDSAVARKYIGGSGLAAKYLYEETDGSTDPLGPDNLLVFMTGPFTGTVVPNSGRHAVAAKSPLTGIWAEGDAGGTWGVMLKRAGFDGILIRGKATEPVYLWVHEQGVEIRPAEHLWGKDTFEVADLIKAETHPKAVVSSIGQAGENLVRIAVIMSDGREGRTAGRGGLGAVMGSKNLKAVAVYGTKRPMAAKEEDLKTFTKEMVTAIRDRTQGMSRFGTAGGLQAMEELGDLPIRNWCQGSWPEGAAKIGGQRMAESILTRNYHCGACVIGCGRVVKLGRGEYAGVEQGGPEYETLASLGALCLVDDLEAVALANEYCNRSGLDTISTGSAIAFAMECWEHGLITAKDTDGLKLEWGSAEAMLTLVQAIARREGLGRLLADGVRAAAQALGPRAEEYAIHVKGLEFPAHDPRAYNSVAVGYATSNRGACHLQGFTHMFEKSVTMPELGYDEIQDRFGVEGKGELTAKCQDLMCLMDALKMCKFSLSGGVKVTHMIKWLNYVTGWDVSLQEFLKTGERIFNLKRLYNVRCGISRKDDILPPRILTHKRGSGGAADNLPPLGKMLSEYYTWRGWSEEGIPTHAKLRELGLEEYIS